VIAPANAWRVVVWPDRGTTFIEWPRTEASARRLFETLQAERVPCCLLLPSGTVAALHECADRVLDVTEAV